MYVCVRVCVCDFICPLSLDVCMCLASIRISASSGPWMFDDPCHVPLGDAVWGFQCVVPLASNNVHKSAITFASVSCEHEGHKPIKTTPTYSDQNLTNTTLTCFTATNDLPCQCNQF